MANGIYKVGTISRLTGFSSPLLRIWEKRHGILAPKRLPGGHRLYGESDLRVLRRVRQLLDEGRSIGEIALLGRRALLAGAPGPATGEAPPRAPAPTADLERFGSALVRAARATGASPSLAIDSGLVLEQFADAVVAASPDGRIVYANAAVEALLGWGSAELVGQPLVVLVPARLRETHAAGFARYFATRVAKLIGHPVRLPALRRDGGECEIELTLACLSSGAGEDLVVASLRDLRDPIALEPRPASARSMRAAIRAVERLTCRLEVPQLLDLVVDTAVADFGAALARIWAVAGDPNVLHLRASAGLSRRTADSSRGRIDLTTYPYKVGVVARSRAPYIKNGLLGDPHFEQPWVAREQLAAVAVLPLTADRSLEGVLACFFRHPLSNEVVEILTAFADVVASSLASHRAAGEL